MATELQAIELHAHCVCGVSLPIVETVTAERVECSCGRKWSYTCKEMERRVVDRSRTATFHKFEGEWRWRWEDFASRQEKSR